MRLHRVTATVAALLTASVLAIGGTAPVWAASPHPSDAAARALPDARIVAKVVLPETSIDGPALSSVVGSFEGVSFNKSVIGWTGTDAAHHLNVETSADGLHFGNKRTLGETSPFRPDVTQLGQPAGGQIIVAWTGSDANRSLNVLFDVFGSSKKLTLRNESSLAAPAVTLIGSFIFLAWTGTNAGHSLNILPINFAGTNLVPGTKIVLSAFSSNAGPHLARRGANGLVLNWTSRALQLNVAVSQTGGANFSRATLPETSAFAPDTSSVEPFIGVSNREWIGWTGTDAAHHLNLQFTTTFPQFTNPGATKTILGDTAFGGPALDFNAGEQIAWTGTDRAHHLNIAKFAFS